MGSTPRLSLLAFLMAQQVGSAAAVRVGAALCLSAAIALFTWSQAERRAARAAAAAPSDGGGQPAVDRAPVRLGRAA